MTELIAGMLTFYILISWITFSVSAVATLVAPFWFASKDKIGLGDRLFFCLCMTSLIWSWLWPPIILAAFCFAFLAAAGRFFSDEGSLEEEEHGHGYE